MNKRIPEIVMIQPKTSLTGSFIRMLPIGLLYAVSRIVKEGIPVHILDTRIRPSAWEKELSRCINKNTAIVGITVMSGVSILESLKISRYIKRLYPAIRVVWGGPHPTFSPEDILREETIDFVIRGYGSVPFYHLVQNIFGAPGALPFDKINGLSYRMEKNNIRHNAVSESFEFIHYRDIPYHLIRNLSDYRHIDGNEIVFPMYSAMGCPYKCTFCSSPAQYAKFNKKWQPYPVKDVIGHIKMVRDSFGATFIYFIDDDSFIDFGHAEEIIDAIKESGISVKLGFRGARINEISLMSDAFLEKLAASGTDSMHIGAESGSNRILRLMKKDITVEQTLQVNRKLARYPQIKSFYNFMVGLPTETFEEIKATRDLILQLIRDNPSCIVLPLNKPRPLPGTELYNLASKFGYRGPKSLEEWGKYDIESSEYNPIWLSKKENKFIRMMFLSMYFIDDKIFKFSVKRNFKFVVLKIIAFLYKPLALFRFKYGYHHLLIEDRIYSFFNHYFIRDF